MKILLGIFLFLWMIDCGADTTKQRCESVFLASRSETTTKIINTVTAPLLALKQKMIYTQEPAILNHKIYKNLEHRLKPRVASALRRILFYSSNALRKSYNVLAADGLGMPLLPIKTRAQIEAELHSAEGLPREFQNTYWSGLHHMMSQNPVLDTLNKGGKKALAALTFSSAVIFSVHTLGNVAITAATEPIVIKPQVSVTQTMPLQAHQVQILNEVTPMPHTAIRIGNNVFSHGVSALTQKHVDFYLRSQQIQGGANSSAIGEELAGAFAKRSLDAITLNLTPEIVAKVQAELMQETGKLYKNTTFVNSCASMIVRILSDQGIVIQDFWLDASPSMMSSRLALEFLSKKQNAQGLPLIEKINSISYDTLPSSQDFLHRFFMRELEVATQLNVRTLPFYAGQRMSVEASNKTTQNFYINTSERKQVIEQFQVQAVQDLKMTQAYYLYDLAKSSGQPREVQDQFRSELKILLENSETLVKDTNISFQDFYIEQFKIDLLRSALNN